MATPAARPPAPLKEHITHTYFSLRLGIAVIGILLPVALWLGGRLLDGKALLGSMSAYYHSPAMRDVFVGALIAVGVCLHLYKGFSPQENRALNAAGLLAAGVALFPTSAPGADATLVSRLHGTFAVLFFLSIAYVCIFRASDTLSLMRDTRQADKRRMLYRALGVGMIVSPAVAVVLSFALPSGRDDRSVTFFVEAVGVWVFAAYWLVKSDELRRTNAERLAMDGRLKEATAGAPRLPAGGRVIQTAADEEPPAP